MTTYAFEIVEAWSYSSVTDFYGDGPERTQGGELSRYTGGIRVVDGESFVVRDGALVSETGDWLDAAGYSDQPPYYASVWGRFRHEIFDYTWSGGTSTIYRVTYDYLLRDGTSFRSVGDYDSWAVLDGPALPAISGPEDFERFTTKGRRSDAGPDFAEGAVVDLGALSGVSVTENDLIEDGFYAPDTRYGGLGNDIFRTSGDDRPNLFDGGPGRDIVDYRHAYPAEVSVMDLGNSDRNDGVARQDVYLSIEGLIGTYAVDEITGTADGNRLRGEDGDDILFGRAGNDVLRGGAGDDVLVGGAGADLLDGGTGWDRARYDDVDRRMTIDMVNGAWSSGDAAGDRFLSIETVEAGSGGVVLRGDGAANRLLGGAGNDVIRGRAGNDALFGQAGDDVLIGDAGNDRLHGGAGADTFRFVGGHDVIRDMTDEDALQISDRFAEGPTLTGADLRDAARVEDGALVLDFGPLHSLTLLGVGSVDDILALTMGY